MRVIIVALEPFPHGMAGTRRILCYARALRSVGIDCEVLLSKRTEKRGCERNTLPVGEYMGVPYRYAGGSTRKGSHHLTRTLFERIDINATEKYLRKNLRPGDVLFLYVGQDPDMMLRFMGAARKAGAFCVRDLCELPYATVEQTEQTALMRQRVLSEQFPLLDGIISISDALGDIAKKWAAPSCRHLKVPIMVDYEEFCLEDRSEEAEIPYILHSGTLYEQKDGILGMIEAFGMALERISMPVRFIMTGSPEESPHRDDILRLIDEYNLEGKVVFKGHLSDEGLKNCLSGASLTIINKYDTLQNRYCFSTKLGEYLAAGKPVIITRVGEAMNWLEDGLTAYVTEPGDTGALAEAIVRAFSEPEERKAISTRARELCRASFDYKSWGKPLLGFMNSLGD